MKHRVSKTFRECFQKLPPEVQQLARQNFEMLKADPRHPSLHFKRVGKKNRYWSVRIGLSYRALGVDAPTGIVWFWIGSHDDYDQLMK